MKNSLALLFIAAVSVSPASEPDPFKKQDPPPIVGRWDLKVHGADREYPSWFEFSQSGYRTLVGRYVGQFGSARPISEIKFHNGGFRFVVPPQWERSTNDFVVEGKLDGSSISGDTSDGKGGTVHWEGHRAPSMVRSHAPEWGKPKSLFNGRDLDGWKARDSTKPNGWRVDGGLLANADPGNDLVTEQKFTDFKIHTTFRYPRKSNSGIYLRGRYEVQIEDNYAKEPDSHEIGGVYGFLTPRLNAAKKAGEWQTMDITLIGREVTIVLNGEPIIERQSIPGITGGALDSDEGAPGPILLQGDHGKIEFKELILTLPL